MALAKDGTIGRLLAKNLAGTRPFHQKPIGLDTRGLLCVCVCVCVLQLQLCPPQHLRLFSPAKHASMLTGSKHFYHGRVEMQMAPQCWYQSHPLDFPASAVVCTKQRDRQKQRVYSFPNSHRQCA